MRRSLCLSAAAALILLASLAYWYGLRPDDGAADENASLTIYSTTDLAEFVPVIADFRAIYPGITVDYIELDAAPLYRRFLEEQASGRPGADLLLSSAMDLQVKLVNDGYAAPHYSQSGQAVPAWARWRDEAFGFTFEPAVMVFNTRQMSGRPLPQSRRELLEAIRGDPDFWRGGVGTYDITTSSVGYLIASQDDRLSSEFSALLKAFGDVGVRVEDNTSTLLDQLRAGRLKVGYNLLGSYARHMLDQGAPLTIVYPGDYTLAVLRTALIPRDAPNPRSAHLFLEYLLSIRGQRLLETRTGLSAIREEVAQELGRFGLSQAEIGLLRPIGLGPGLLVYLDQRKRRRLLDNWSTLVREPAD
jgi:iron(III) transport system substrate-binding protein